MTTSLSGVAGGVDLVDLVVDLEGVAGVGDVAGLESELVD